MRFAPILALLAFGYVCVAGISVGGGFTPVTEQALMALAVFWLVGLVVGPLGEQVVTEIVLEEIDEEKERCQQLSEEVANLIQNGLSPVPSHDSVPPEVVE